eukprot:jgi/Hompol1/4089/HPOL_006915-RA
MNEIAHPSTMHEDINTLLKAGMTAITSKNSQPLELQNPETDEVEHINIRSMAITAFRNYVVWPNRSRLQGR